MYNKIMIITTDPAKNKLNLQKHQINVESVFYDDCAITVEDRDHTEERFVTLGVDGFGRLLVVAYHYRHEDEIRIISARSAEPDERRTYEGIKHAK